MYGWLPTVLIREVDMLSDAFVWYFVFDSMSGKCVAGSSVVVVVSLSSCSFLLMVDEVIDNRKCHMPDHVHQHLLAEKLGNTEHVYISTD